MDAYNQGDWLVGWSVGRLVGWSVGWLVGWLVMACISVMLLFLVRGWDKEGFVFLEQS